MKVIITYYSNDYSEKKETYLTELPLQFGFGSYNEGLIVKGIPRKIFVENIISIDVNKGED